MKIKIIDLLNKIANDEEVPKKIKWLGQTYEYNHNDRFYYQNGWSMYIDFYTEGNCLNDEVEILDEEEFEDIYNFCWNENYLFSNRQTGMTKEDRRLLDSNFKDIHDTINKLIKNQKKIIERLNNLGE